MTSLEFLFNELWETPKDKFTWCFILNKAKEMHKQEIIDARNDMQKKCIELANKINPHLFEFDKKDGEQYYQETFVSKGSGDKKINLVEIPQEQLEKERNPNYKYFNIDEPKLPQQEISDEEIWKASINYDNGAFSETPIVHFEQGAFWYREQLKQL